MDNFRAFYGPLNKSRQQEVLELAENRVTSVIVGDANSNMHTLFSEFEWIVAAGGVVKNNDGAILFIYRNDKWDLPKGKLEIGESVETCALREVEEECGINALSIKKELPSTWHTYDHKGKRVLKRTYWYEMSTTSPDLNLVPQTEEGITKVEWVKGDLRLQKSNTYNSILELLKTV